MPSSGRNQGERDPAGEGVHAVVVAPAGGEGVVGVQCLARGGAASSTLFPYTTLFRSVVEGVARGHLDVEGGAGGLGADRGAGAVLDEEVVDRARVDREIGRAHV